MPQKLYPLLSFALLLTVSQEDFIKAQSVPQLPAPTGQYAVGRRVFDWTDAARHEPTSADLATRRELLVYVWYPATAHTGTPAPYLDPDQSKLSGMSGVFGPAWKMVQAGAIATHTLLNAKLAPTHRPFPVLIFSPGLGGPTAGYTFLLEDLASHGYIVAAVEHTHVTAPVAFPDGRTAALDFSLGGPRLADDDEVDVVSREMRAVDLCAADLQFVLDEMTKLDREKGSQFFGKIDTQNVGVLGQSVGGRVAVRACQRDARFRACLNEDGTLFYKPFVPDNTGKPLSQPFMMIDHEDAPMPEAMFQQMHTTREAYDQMRSEKIKEARRSLYSSVLAGSYEVTLKVPDAIHGSFSDLALLRATTDAQRAHQTRIMELDRLYTRRFFDKFLLKDASVALTDTGIEAVVVTFEPAGKAPVIR